MSQLPVVVGLTICEQIIVEAETHNLTLVNCFSRREVETIPSEPISFVVFATLTNGAGDVPLAVQISRLDTLDEIYVREMVLRFPDPLAEVRLRLRIRDCVFPVAGLYSVFLLAKDEMVAQRRLRIFLREVES